MCILFHILRVSTSMFIFWQKRTLLLLLLVVPQTDVMHQSVYELVHTEDQQELRRNLHWALNPPAITKDSPQGDHSPPLQGNSHTLDGGSNRCVRKLVCWDDLDF